MKNGCKIKILFIIPNLYLGGSQRFIINLIKKLNRKKYYIILVVLKMEKNQLNELPSDITLIDLKVKKTRYMLLKLIKLINNKKPNIIFSISGYMNLLVILSKIVTFNKIKYIGRESSITSYNNRRMRYPFLINIMYKLFYNYFDYIICQSRSMQEDLKDNFKILQEKLVVINNHVDFDYIKQKNTYGNVKNKIRKINYKLIVAAGRLSYEKGFDLLIKAFSKIKNGYTRLYILGIGDEEDKLKELCKKLNMENRVLFLGFKQNPYVYMQEADIFVLSSRYEGFPNAVLEAMACGTQVVAFNCPGGVGEIITNGINGWLVESQNTAALARAIEYALEHPLDSDIIRKSIWDRYRAEIIVKRYEKLFEKVLEK